MSAEGKPKKCPIGTIRHWQTGDVIKAYENSIFGNGWISLRQSTDLDELGGKLDKEANSVFSYKLPIHGEKFLDHEINGFEKGDEEFGPFTSDQFKQYEDFHGAAKYSFRNEFYRRYMSGDLKKAELVDEALRDANDHKKEKAGKFGFQFAKLVLLTEGEIKEIRRSVRSEYHEDSAFDKSQIERLYQTVKKTCDQIKKGVDFEGDEKEIFQAASQIASTIPDEYEKINIKKKTVKDLIQKINETFPDNWGVRESFKDFINDKYSSYVRKYKEQIKIDSAKDQEDFFGVRMDAPTDEFYLKLYEKFEKDPDDSGDNFQELIYLRFETLYGKSLEGEWTKEHLSAIQSFEHLITNLPQGHLLTNDSIRLLTNIDYKGGNHGGYAWYDGQDKRINLSAKLLNYAGVFGKLSNPVEFDNTLVHEIGHAVSKKLGRIDNMDYRRFFKECGWSIQQTPVREGFTATGDDKPIVREGSNSDLNLLTDYAHTSPEEAFAEYYSIYYNNKKAIDSWLDTNDDFFIKKHKKEIIANELSEVSVKSISHIREDYALNEEMRELSMNLSLYPYDEHVKVELLNPWKLNVHKQAKDREDKSHIRNIKQRDFKFTPPIITINDREHKTVLDGYNRMESAKINKKAIPSITISKEFESCFRDRGYNIDQITKFAYHLAGDKKIPVQKQSENKTIEGLIYRNEILDVSKLKKNQNALRAMKRLFNSDALRKALIDLGIEI